MIWAFLLLSLCFVVTNSDCFFIVFNKPPQFTALGNDVEMSNDDDEMEHADWGKGGKSTNALDKSRIGKYSKKLVILNTTARETNGDTKLNSDARGTEKLVALVHIRVTGNAERKEGARRMWAWGTGDVGKWECLGAGLGEPVGEGVLVAAEEGGVEANRLHALGHRADQHRVLLRREERLQRPSFPLSPAPPGKGRKRMGG